jgi:hypothetical protein
MEKLAGHSPVKRVKRIAARRGTREKRQKRSHPLPAVHGVFRNTPEMRLIDTRHRCRDAVVDGSDERPRIQT